ncbi:MAG: hydrogenase, partial [Planctomycetes bacterium]|nr:hydrogenase [Planctomycetota bacterium]
IMVSCNVISPQTLWFKKLRRSPMFLFVMSIFVNIGMWFERFVIIVTSLHRDYLPSSWSYYYPTWIELGTLIGSFGLFFFLFFLFIRVLPAVAFGEVKGVMNMGKKHPFAQKDGGGDDATEPTMEEIRQIAEQSKEHSPEPEVSHA